RMIRVGVTRVADQLGNRLRSATEGVVTFLDYKKSSALSEHKSVAVAIPRPRRTRGFVVPERHSAHRTKAGHSERRDRRLGATADHHISVTVLNDSVRFSDGVCTCSTRRSVREIGSCGPPTDGNLASGQIDDSRCYEKRRNTSGTLARELCVFPFDGFETADAAPDRNSDAITCFGIHIETRISNREFGGGQGKLNEPGGFLDILFPHEIEGIKTGKLPSNPAGQGSCVEERNGPDSRTASQDTLPGTLGSDSGRAEEPNPSYDHATPLAHPFHPPILLSIA